jgi:hypothetical protein
VTDLVTNGLEGTFTNTPAGQVRATRFDSIMGDVFKNNYPETPPYYEALDDYIKTATEALSK